MIEVFSFYNSTWLGFIFIFTHFYSETRQYVYLKSQYPLEDYNVSQSRRLQSREKIV